MTQKKKNRLPSANSYATTLEVGLIEKILFRTRTTVNINNATKRKNLLNNEKKRLFRRFLEHLQNIEEKNARDYQALRAGQKIRREQRKAVKDRDRSIRIATLKLDNGEYSIVQFLEKASNFMEPDATQRRVRVVS